MSTVDPLAQFLPPSEDEQDDPLLKFLPPQEKKKERLTPFQTAAAIGSMMYGKPSGATGEDIIEGIKGAAKGAVELVTGDNKYNIPAVQETEEWSNLGKDEQLGAIFSPSDVAGERYLSVNPNLKRDEEDPNLVRKDGKPYAYIEQPGIGKTDVVEGLTTLGASAVLPLAATASRATQTGRALWGGAAELATQLGIENIDLEEGVSGLNLALSAVSPALGELVTTLRGTMTKGQINAYIDKGKKYVSDKLGINPSDLKDDTLLVFGQKSQNKLKNEVSDQSIITSIEDSIPLTKGQAMVGGADDAKAAAQMREEAGLANSEGGWFNEDIMNEFQDRQQRAVADYGERKLASTKAGRSEADTGQELISSVQRQESAVKTAAKADQAEKVALIGETPPMSATQALPEWKRGVQSVIEKHNLTGAAADAQKPLAKGVTQEVFDRVESQIQRGVNIPEGDVQEIVNQEMRYMKVPAKHREAVSELLSEARDADPADLRDIRFNLEDKYNMKRSDINEAFKSIQGVQRAQKAEPLDMKDLSDTYEQINGALRDAAEGSSDEAALRSLRTEYEGYMQGAFTDYVKRSGNIEALNALEGIGKANKSWKAYKDIYSRQYAGDTIGANIDKIVNGRLSPEKVVGAIVGADNINMDARDMKRLIDAAGRDAGSEDLVREAIERRIWSTAKTSIPNEKTTKQSFDKLYQILHGDRRDLGNILYPKGSEVRKQREQILKTMDTLIRSKAQGSTRQELMNTLYARLNLGGMRTVIGLDPSIGSWVRKRAAQDAIDPFKLKNREWNRYNFWMTQAAEEAGKE